MRVALSGDYNTKDTGPSRVHGGLAHGLAEVGHDVLMITHGDRESHPHERVEVRRLHGGLASVMDHVTFYRQAKAVADKSTDIYHTIEDQPEVSDVRTVQWVTTLPTALRHYPRDINIREELGDILVNVMARRGAKRASYVSASSPETKRQMERYWRLSPDKVIPLGIKENAIEPSSPPANPPRVLFPGRLHPKKGQKRVLKYLDPKDMGYQVDIVGGRADESYARECLDGWADNYHGFVSRERLIDLYRKSDIVVIPSYHENFSMTAIEAVARGCAVVITDNCGFSLLDEVSRPDSGVSVVSNGINAAMEVQRLTQSDRLQETKNNAVETARSLTWEQIAKRYDDIYQSIMDDR